MLYKGYHVFSLIFLLRREQLDMNQESDENMVKMMTQFDLLLKHVMTGGKIVVDSIGKIIGMSIEEAILETIYNKEVKFLLN